MTLKYTKKLKITLLWLKYKTILLDFRNGARARNDTLIENVKVIRDLGIYFDNKLTFVYHTEYAIKLLKVPGFIKRHTKEYRNIIAIKSLYTLLIRFHLENCSVI